MGLSSGICRHLGMRSIHMDACKPRIVAAPARAGNRPTCLYATPARGRETPCIHASTAAASPPARGHPPQRHRPLEGGCWETADARRLNSPLRDRPSAMPSVG